MAKIPSNQPATSLAFKSVRDEESENGKCEYATGTARTNEGRRRREARIVYEMNEYDKGMIEEMKEGVSEGGTESFRL